MVTVPLAAAKILDDSLSHVGISIQNAGDGAGLFLLPILAESLLEHFSWRQTMLLVAGAILNTAVCGSLIKTRPKDGSQPPIFQIFSRFKQNAVAKTVEDLEEEQEEKQPIQSGLMGGPTFPQPRCSSQLSVLYQDSLKPPTRGAGHLHGLLRSLDFLSNVNFLILFFSGILDSTAVSAFFTFFSTFLKHTMDEEAIDAEVLMVIGAVSIVGRLLVSLMNGRRVPRWAVFAMGHMVQGLTMLALVWLPPCRMTVFSCALVLGLSTGISGALLCCVCQDVCGQEQLAKVFSYSMFAWGIGSTAGPSIAGALSDLCGSESIPITVAGWLFLGSGCLLLCFSQTTKSCRLCSKIDSTAPIVAPATDVKILVDVDPWA